MTSRPRNRFSKTVLIALTLLALIATPIAISRAGCNFCLPVPMSLSEQLATADFAVLASWIDAEKGTKPDTGKTTFQIRNVIKGSKDLAKDQKVSLDRLSKGKPGELFVVLGAKPEKGEGSEWLDALAVSETSYQYLIQAPTGDIEPSQRLKYFVNFLESTDPVIANDAYTEFATAEHKDIEQLASQLPAAKLHSWIKNPETLATRLGLYGMMLGLCGTVEDARMLESKIQVQTDEFRLGIDGVIAGYLLIAKEQGLDVVDKHILTNKKIPFSETFAAMQAMRFMWTEGGTRIAPERLRKSMRILLDRPELSDLVIADLARWKDWSIQDQLMTMYGTGEFNIPSVKRAIVRYMLVCSKDAAPGGDAPHAARALKYLDELRTKDPKTVSQAERFFVAP